MNYLDDGNKFDQMGDDAGQPNIPRLELKSITGGIGMLKRSETERAYPPFRTINLVIFEV